MFLECNYFKLDKKQDHKTNACPVCFNDSSVSLIPLTKDEVYELSIRSKGGLEMKFSKLIKV
jgi:hypothetical protein